MDLNLKCKTVKLLEEYLVEILLNLGHGEQFLDMTLKTLCIKKMKNLGFIKTFYL